VKYQLVVRWSFEAIADLDRLVLIENMLIDGLPPDCIVDGHDIGGTEANIFLLTDDPKKTFDDIQAVLRGEFLTKARALYREVDGEEYEAI
jgi:hypothetical protein